MLLTDAEDLILTLCCFVVYVDNRLPSDEAASSADSTAESPEFGRN